MRRGIGPTCIRKVLTAIHGSNKDGKTDPLDTNTMDVTFRRIDTLGVTNIPIRHRHHDTTGGVEWGYSGSGAADLALNILATFMPVSLARKGAKTATLWDHSKVLEKAFNLHQDFKAAFIAPMNYAGGRIEGRVIRDWLIERGVSPKQIVPISAE